MKRSLRHSTSLEVMPTTPRCCDIRTHRAGSPKKKCVATCTATVSRSISQHFFSTFRLYVLLMKVSNTGSCQASSINELCCLNAESKQYGSNYGIGPCTCRPDGYKFLKASAKRIQHHSLVVRRQTSLVPHHFIQDLTPIRAVHQEQENIVTKRLTMPAFHYAALPSPMAGPVYLPSHDTDARKQEPRLAPLEGGRVEVMNMRSSRSPLCALPSQIREGGDSSGDAQRAISNLYPQTLDRNAPLVQAEDSQAPFVPHR